MKKGIFWAIAIIVIVIIISLVSGKEDTSDTIKVGFIAPLSGTAAVYGEPARASALLAEKEINANGGILGKQVKLIIEDGKCEGTASASAAQKLINADGVKAILGGHCSTESMTIAPIAEKAKVVTIASITSSPKYTNAGEYLFRNSPSSEFFTAKSADHAYSLGYRKIAALYENKEFPIGTFDAFAERFKELGGTIVSNEAYNSDVNDLRSYILKATNEKPDAVMFVPQAPAGMISFLKQMRDAGLLNKYPVIAGATAINPDVNLQTSGLLNNPKIFATDGFADPKGEKTAQFVDAYKKEYGTLPPTNLAYMATSYDALYLVKDAMESCSSATDTECMKNYLGNLKDWKGAVGTITLGKNGSPVVPIGLHYFTESGEEIWKELK